MGNLYYYTGAIVWAMLFVLIGLGGALLINALVFEFMPKWFKKLLEINKKINNKNNS